MNLHKKRPAGYNQSGRFENRHENIQGCFQHFGNNKMGILLLSCRLAKPGRYVSIAAFCTE